MPLTSTKVADAFGAATLAVAVIFASAAVFCAGYVLYFRSRVKSRRAYGPLQYFNLHWLFRLALVVSSLLWALAEILRQHLLRRNGWALHVLNIRWQHNLCRIYLLWNLGLMEPAMYLCLAVLLCKSLSQDSGEEEASSGDDWPPRRRVRCRRTLIFSLVLCLFVFVLQLFFSIVSPSLQFHNGYKHEKEGFGAKIPGYFTREFRDSGDDVFCAYPLFSVIVHAVFASILIMYLLYVGTRMVKKVINKVLQRRIYWLIFAVLLLLPVRILFLGFSSLCAPGKPVFEVMVFIGFFAQIVYGAVAVKFLVYMPVADSLAVKYICNLKEISSNQGISMTSLGSLGWFGGVSDNDEHSGNIASQSLLEEGTATVSTGRDSDSSAKVGSISFRTMLKDVSAEQSDEVNLYMDSNRAVGSPGSPPLFRPNP